MPPALTVTEGTSGLHVRNLRKSYKKRLVIRDISLDLMRGEVVALLGPNGCGKTTTFYSIAGLVTPEGGQVLIDGNRVFAARDVDLPGVVGRRQHHGGSGDFRT